jgi:hypothetical protein
LAVEASEPGEAAPPEAASELSLLVDTLLPGDELFPAGSAVGTQALLAQRLIRLRGSGALGELAQAIVGAGGPLGTRDAAGRRAVVAALQQAQPQLFDDMLRVAYLSYYEMPIVQDGIRALGFSYHAMPLPGGYAEAVGKFDPARDTPTHRRGAYVPTDAVRRADLGKLALPGGSDGE